MGKVMYFVIGLSRKTGKWKFIVLPKEERITVDEYDNITKGRWRYYDQILLSETTYG